MAPVEISVIVPCYNEEHRIAGLLNAIHNQTVPLDSLEVVIADGRSTDHTLDVIHRFQNDNPELLINIIDNPKRNIPSGLNLAINKAQGEFIIRVDAHSIPNANYIQLCIQHLKSKKANNIGGVWVIKPGNNSKIAKAIAIAASHPLGVGGAQYRDKNTKASFVDTVPFGSYRKDYLLTIGLYDENLLSNEDYELNTRIRDAGGKIYLDPQIRCVYFARGTLSDLARQYYRYGFWKYRMLKRYPSSIKTRQFLPPVFVLGISLLFLGGLFLSLLFYSWFAVTFLYILSIFIGTFLVPNQSTNSFGNHALTTLAIITMHLSWGSGFLLSPLIGIFR